MTATRGLLIAALVAGCGGKSRPAPAPTSEHEVAKPAPATPPADDCQLFADKSRSKLEELMGKLSDSDVAELIKQCREKGQQDPLVKCVAASKDDAIMRACWDVALKPRKPSDAAINLNKIAKNAKIAWESNSQFPKGKAGPTPATPCGCGKKCAVEPTQWTKNPVWSELEFTVDEESFYQYTYESDGKTYKATAISDLDCDGTSATWVMSGVGGPDGATATLTVPKGEY